MKEGKTQEQIYEEEIRKDYKEKFNELREQYPEFAIDIDLDTAPLEDIPYHYDLMLYKIENLERITDNAIKAVEKDNEMVLLYNRIRQLNSINEIFKDPEIVQLLKELLPGRLVTRMINDCNRYSKDPDSMEEIMGNWTKADINSLYHIFSGIGVLVFRDREDFDPDRFRIFADSLMEVQQLFFRLQLLQY